MPRPERIVGQFTVNLTSGSAEVAVPQGSYTAIHLRSFSADTLVGTWPNMLGFKISSKGIPVGKELIIDTADNSAVIFEVGLNTNSQGRWFGVNNGPLVELNPPIETNKLKIEAFYRTGTTFTVATATSLWARFELVFKNE